MKNLLLLVIAVSLSILATAQDQKAKEILDKVSAKAKSFKSIYAEFNFKMVNEREDVSETYSGKLWNKAEKYKLELMGTVTYFDGTTIWTHMKDAEEVNISEPDPEDDNALNPAKIWTMYEKGFKWYYKQEKFEANRALIYIDLIPKDLESEYSRITLKIDKDKGMLYSMIRYGKDGNIYTITVINYKTDQPQTDSMFKFDKTKFPGVEINDLR